MILFLIITIITAIFIYAGYIRSNVTDMRNNTYKIEAESMQKKVSLMILQKQKSTMAIALSLANDKRLVSTLEHRDIAPDYYKELITNFEKETLYKNVWINLIDKDGISIYRSWTDIKGDRLIDIRDDLRYVFSTKKTTYSISIGMFDLSIKSMVPVFNGEKFVGVLEVITHFNSIVKNLESSNIESVVVVAKDYSEQLKYPFTKLFIKNYYVANIDASKELLDYLEKHNVENYFHRSYKVENGYVIASCGIKNIKSEDIGYFLMFKKISDINEEHLDFFTFKGIVIFILLALIALFIVSTIMLIKNRNQKRYYKSILDTSSNIVIVNDSEQIIDANKAFFAYFYTYHSLDDFLKYYQCICDLFVPENGCLQKQMGELYWIDYIILNKGIRHKAKIRYLDHVYYFAVTAAQISQNPKHYSIIFSDISKEEQYQKDLIELSIKDSLTGIYNRHYFDQKIEEEVARTDRYKTPFSLVMLDIDFFKRVNDEYGHETGDMVLIEYTRFVSDILRKTDVFCRTGGEEFMIILTNTALEEAEIISQKLRLEIEEHKKVLPITMSFGVVQYQSGESIKSLLKRVDDALYTAKKSGRNIVILG